MNDGPGESIASSGTDILRRAHSVLVIDWPSPDVPDSLVRAGLSVFVKGGPGPRDFAVRDLCDGDVVTRSIEDPPGHVDIVYAYRPLDELSAIVELARQLGAFAVWRQADLPTEEAVASRKIVAAAGLQYVDDIDIADAGRELRQSP